jgi:uncharacterized OsmC-like protein
MDAQALRSLQAPLKRRYRDEPTSAVTPVDARAAFDEPRFTCTVDTWSGPVTAGLHRATGGDGREACSADMLMQAVVACAGVTLRCVAAASGIDIHSARLVARSSFDARGTLGISCETDVGVGDVDIEIAVDTDADDAKLARLAELTERYCVVGQSLRRPARVRVQRAGDTSVAVAVDAGRAARQP